MQLIDGKAIAQKSNDQSRAAVMDLRARGITPGLAVVLIGENPASVAYVRSKDRKCQELGMHSVKHELPVATSQAKIPGAKGANLFWLAEKTTWVPLIAGTPRL